MNSSIISKILKTLEGYSLKKIAIVLAICNVLLILVSSFKILLFMFSSIPNFFIAIIFFIIINLFFVLALTTNSLIKILISIICGFVVGMFILIAAGFNPITYYQILFSSMFASPKNISVSIIQATPIIITALSAIFAFKSGLFNIGAEGQFIIGSVTASFFGYYVITQGIFKNLTFFHPLIVILFAMLAGGIYGGIVGILKAKFGIHEVLSSIMFNWIALYSNNLYVEFSGFKKEGSEAVREIQTSAYINFFKEYKTGGREGIKQLIAKIREVFTDEKTSKIVEDIVVRTDINYGIIIAIVCAIVIWLIITKTTLGYSLRAVGLNKDAAEFAGINVPKNIFLSMAISGAIAGLAGAIYIMSMGLHRVYILGMLENYGFNGLSVALISGLHPIGAIFSGFFYSSLINSGAFLQEQLGTPIEIINIVIGVMVFFVGMQTIFNKVPSIIQDAISKK